MDETPRKRCTGCGQEFPATPEFFVRASRYPDGVRPYCKVCHARQQSERSRRQKLAQVPQISEQTSDVGPDGPDFAPDGPGQNGTIPLAGPESLEPESDEILPDRCASCGTTRGNIIGDIDKATHERYGSICMPCYRLLRESAADARRMRNVLTYIERTRIHHV